MSSAVQVLVLIYIQLGLYFAYQMRMLFLNHKICRIIVGIINTIVFISPYILYRYEVLEAINRNATGWDAAPFGWFLLILLLGLMYIVNIIILLIIKIIRKKKRVGKDKC